MKYITKNSGKRKKFSTGMVRDCDDMKERYDLIIPIDGSVNIIKRLAQLMTRGAIKYEERNWEKAKTKEEYDRFKQSSFRHFMQWYNGEKDEDHMSAVIFNMMGAEYVDSKLNKKNKNML